MWQVSTATTQTLNCKIVSITPQYLASSFLVSQCSLPDEVSNQDLSISTGHNHTYCSETYGDLHSSYMKSA
jgi:hypothetical protein